jgi:hypothetical protein
MGLCAEESVGASRRQPLDWVERDFGSRLVDVESGKRRSYEGLGRNPVGG